MTFSNRKGPHQHEVLVDHADTERDGVFRCADAYNVAVHFDLPFVGAVHAEKDVRWGGFAGSIFTDNPVDRSTRNGKRCRAA